MMTQTVSNHSISALTIPSPAKNQSLEEDIIWLGNNHGEIMAVDISAIDVTKLENEHTLNVVHKWRGHCKAVTNLTIVENHDLLGRVLSRLTCEKVCISCLYLEVVSTSFDRTCRLWNTEGHCVGTFGQSEQWELTRKETWLHPFTPDDVLVDVELASEEQEEKPINQSATKKSEADENDWLSNVKENIDEANGKRLLSQRFLSAHPKFYRKDPASNAFRLT